MSVTQLIIRCKISRFSLYFSQISAERHPEKGALFKIVENFCPFLSISEVSWFFLNNIFSYIDIKTMVWRVFQILRENNFRITYLLVFRFYSPAIRRQLQTLKLWIRVPLIFQLRVTCTIIHLKWYVYKHRHNYIIYLRAKFFFFFFFCSNSLKWSSYYSCRTSTYIILTKKLSVCQSIEIRWQSILLTLNVTTFSTDLIFRVFVDIVCDYILITLAVVCSWVQYKYTVRSFLCILRVEWINCTWRNW